MSSPSQSGASVEGYRQNDNLAFVFQELITAILRLRSGRQTVTDAAVFRNQVRQALAIADQNAKRLGYVDEDILLAKFAVVAFLDESILNLYSPVFAEWVRKPLQEEFFGRHVAGEVVFDNLQRLLGRRDSSETADVLEVYLLCLLLGYAGRYSIGGMGELRSIINLTGDKIQRIRKLSPDLSPEWKLPAVSSDGQYMDRWLRPLGIAAAACFLLAAALFGAYKVSLGAGAREIGGYSLEQRGK
jgi:type VI secretion system protein ImpK